MAEIINLRLARKAKARAEKGAEAAENRARHGRTATERDRDASDADRLRRTLDGAKQDDT